MTSTIRQQIIELLKLEALDSFQIAKKLGASPKSIESHLEHVAKTMKGQFHMNPSICRDCGFKFAKREKNKKPTKCPQCKGENISLPMFFIMK